MSRPYPRDLTGYGRQRPQARWPDGARVAVQFVLNYEEGGENSVLHGDAGPSSSSRDRVQRRSRRATSASKASTSTARAGVTRLLRSSSGARRSPCSR
jgi:hypothetical protein